MTTTIARTLREVCLFGDPSRRYVHLPLETDDSGPDQDGQRDHLWWRRASARPTLLGPVGLVTRKAKS